MVLLFGSITWLTYGHEGGIYGIMLINNGLAVFGMGVPRRRLRVTNILTQRRAASGYREIGGFNCGADWLRPLSRALECRELAES